MNDERLTYKEYNSNWLDNESEMTYEQKIVSKLHTVRSEKTEKMIHFLRSFFGSNVVIDYRQHDGTILNKCPLCGCNNLDLKVENSLWVTSCCHHDV